MKKILEELNQILFDDVEMKKDASELPEEYRVKTGYNHMGWVHVVYKFPNGYGASIVGYGDKWEMAVLDVNNDITYKTNIADGVIRGDSELMQRLIGEIKSISV